jgi:hypothetical protein
MATEEMDPIQQFVRKIEDAQKLLKNSQASAENMRAHMHGTVLPLMIEMASLLAQSQEGMLDYVDGRIAEVQGEATAIVGEDAEKLLALAEGTAWLVGELRKNLTEPAAILRLDELEKLATDCKEIVEEARIEDDDPDETDPAKVN